MEIKRFLSLIVFLCSFTCLTHAYWQNGWSVSPVALNTFSSLDSHAPQVAMDQAGNAIAVWHKADGSNSRIQTSYYNQETRTWSEAINISEAGQDAYSPQIAMDAVGNGIAVWYRYDGSNYIAQSSYYDQLTETWSVPVNLSEAGQNALYPQIAMDAAGNGIAVWQRSDGDKDRIQTSYYNQETGTWSEAINISEAGQYAGNPQVAMDPTGNGIAVWYRSDGSNQRIQASHYDQLTETWSVPVNLSEAGQNAFYPQIAMDAFGNGIAVWRRDDGSNDIAQSSYYNQSTEAWSVFVNLSVAGQDAGNPQVAMDPTGNGIAVWYRSDGSNQRIQASYYNQAAGTWSIPINLSESGQSATIPQVAMDAFGNGIVVWKGSNDKVEVSRYVKSSNGWQAPINLSLAGQYAFNPQIAMNASGNGVAVWRRIGRAFRAPDSNIQASHFNFEPCGCPVVRYENITNLPTVYGEVGQFQIEGSRLGAEAHLMIDGGWVRELIHLSSCRSGDAPVSVIILQNDGRVGLGSTHRNVDSLEASIVLGVNGVTLIANGNSRVDLNEDIIVNNVCHILTGPDFGGGTVEKLIIHSDEGHTIRVKSTGVLDLGSFITENQLIEFSGDLKIVLEPGAKVMLGGSTMIVTDNVRIECDTLSDNQVPEGSSVTATDNVRVKFVGTGRVQFKGNSKFVINKGAFVGIESFEECNIFDTALRFELNEYSRIFLGEDVEGGAFQVGNTTDITDANITFSLLIYGYDAGFIINSQGFLGFNVGVAGKANEQPNSWWVNTLHNVDLISIDVNNGMFVHDRIFTGTDPRASLVALGLSQTTTTTFYFEYSPVDSPSITNISKSTILGGGNFALVKTYTAGLSINPTVLDDAGEITDYLSVGLLASKPLLGTADLFGFGNAQDLFNYWKTTGMLTNAEVSTLSNAASGLRNKIRLGFIDQNKIGRDSTYSIVGDGGIFSKQEHTLEIGAVQILVSLVGDAPRSVLQAFELN